MKAEARVASTVCTAFILEVMSRRLRQCANEMKTVTYIDEERWRRPMTMRKQGGVEMRLRFAFWKDETRKKMENALNRKGKK